MNRVIHTQTCCTSTVSGVGHISDTHTHTVTCDLSARIQIPPPLLFWDNRTVVNGWLAALSSCSIIMKNTVGWFNYWTLHKMSNRHCSHEARLFSLALLSYMPFQQQSPKPCSDFFFFFLFEAPSLKRCLKSPFWFCILSFPTEYLWCSRCDIFSEQRLQQKVSAAHRKRPCKTEATICVASSHRPEKNVFPTTVHVHSTDTEIIQKISSDVLHSKCHSATPLNQWVLIMVSVTVPHWWNTYRATSSMMAQGDTWQVHYCGSSNWATGDIFEGPLLTPEGKLVMRRNRGWHFGSHDSVSTVFGNTN